MHFLEECNSQMEKKASSFICEMIINNGGPKLDSA